AKSVGTSTAIENRLPRLRELWALDAVGAERRFRELLGDTGRPVEEWLCQPPHEWEQLRVRMHTRTRYRSALRVADTARRLRRTLRPAGVHIAVLGPDGSGKST